MNAISESRMFKVCNNVVGVEDLAPKVFPRVTLVSVNTLSVSVVRTLRGGELLPNMFCLSHSN